MSSKSLKDGATGKRRPPILPSGRHYHHGDLRRVLIETTIHLIESDGLESISVREVAKRAGVSPGAPFRHFPSRTALLTAVAEDAMDRLVHAIDAETSLKTESDGLEDFHAIGRAFLRWAIEHPTHFAVISNRSVFAYETSSIPLRNRELQARMANILTRALEKGQITGDATQHAITGRALVYGIARMFIDGQFPAWGLSVDEPFVSAIRLFDGYVQSISRPSGEPS